MRHPSLLDHFSGLDDPRQRGKALYSLPEIMLLILCATLSGAEDFVETRVWGLKKLRFLRGMLPFKRGIPSAGASSMRKVPFNSKPSSRTPWQNTPCCPTS